MGQGEGPQGRELEHYCRLLVESSRPAMDEEMFQRIVRFDNQSWWEDVC